MALKKGDILPDFALPDQEGVDFSHTDLKKGSPVVIYFYPKDFTPGCTKEACSFRDRYQDFQSMGAEVIGVSSDSVSRHQRFREKFSLPFRLLSDKDGSLRKKFGIKDQLFGLLPGRETFVFDRDHRLAHRFNSMQSSPHITQALKVLERL
ncbi:peroxiredoxin [Robertkochia aurantiaca]|uniref:peroxiredoxin n=1 Tax=Robertkochia aurantiaca TaxID=2873700 RepID=UPI001CCF3CC2|nr:peroxiredoxin [Robertkochia sp. 3YJGBD-33]